MTQIQASFSQEISGNWKIFNFVVFTIPEAVSLPDQPPDLVVESLHRRIADTAESPKTHDTVHLVANRSRHRFQFRF
ncbi:MAG: hypothetical protein MJ033_07820 [Victivallaceae bacterium]|nr:hypothetical protein [Victivallaceae bacterium]